MNNQCLFERYFNNLLSETMSTGSVGMGVQGPVDGSIGPYKSIYAGDDTRQPYVIGAKKKKKKKKLKETFPIVRRAQPETVFLTGK